MCGPMRRLFVLHEMVPPPHPVRYTIQLQCVSYREGCGEDLDVVAVPLVLDDLLLAGVAGTR
jgi:hypothetical protein